MTVSDPTAVPPDGVTAPTVAPPPSLAEVLAHALLVVTGTVQRDDATGRRTLRVSELLRGHRDDLALLTGVPMPDRVADGGAGGVGEVVLIVGEATAPGAPADPPVDAPAGLYLLADPADVDVEQVKRVLAGLPALPPVDGTPDGLAAAADLVLVGGPTGATRPVPGGGKAADATTAEMEAGPAEIEVEVLVREVLAARPDALEQTDLAGRPVGPALAVDDRPRVWVAVEAASADRFRQSIPGPWFVASGDDGRLRSLTRSTPEQFLDTLRPLRARLRAAAVAADNDAAHRAAADGTGGGGR